MSIAFHAASHRLAVTIETPTFEAADARQLAEDLSSFASEPVEDIDLDFTSVEQADSVAFQQLLEFPHRFRTKSPPRLALRNPSPPVRKVINLLGLGGVFAVTQPQ